MTYLTVASLVFLATGLIVFLSGYLLKTAGENYRAHFIAAARTNLTDLFIFIEPEKLYLLNITLLAVSLAFLWFYFGNFIPALVLSLLLALLPQFLYKWLKKKRLETFNESLPDALNSLATMLLAGTHLTAAIDIMTAETKGAIAQEFGLLLREITMGRDMDEALDSMYTRVPSEDLSLVVSGIKISREVGGSLAEVLLRLSDTIRRRIEMEGKINSLTAMGKAQGLVMAVLPLALGYLLLQIEPDAMSRIYTTPVGWMICAVIVVMEILGFLVIRKIVNINV